MGRVINFFVMLMFIYMAGKSFIRKMDSDSPSEEKKFSCHICAKSFKKVMSFISI